MHQSIPAVTTPGHTLGICKALCPGGWDFVQQRVASFGGGVGDNLTDRQINAVARNNRNLRSPKVVHPNKETTLCVPIQSTKQDYPLGS